MIIILKIKKGKGKKNGRTREGECISGVFFGGGCWYCTRILRRFFGTCFPSVERTSVILRREIDKKLKRKRPGLCYLIFVLNVSSHSVIILLAYHPEMID